MTQALQILHLVHGNLKDIDFPSSINFADHDKLILIFIDEDVQKPVTHVMSKVVILGRFIGPEMDFLP